MKSLIKLTAASAVLMSGAAYAGNHTSSQQEFSLPVLEYLNQNGSGDFSNIAFDNGNVAWSGLPAPIGSGSVQRDGIGSRYRQNTSSPDDTVAATATAGGTFTLKGKVSADCSFYNGSSSNHTLDLGTIGIRTGDNENVTVAFNQAATATAHVDTATAGCNTKNTVTITETNSGRGLENTAPGNYDSAQFTNKIAYALSATWTGAGTTTATGTTQTLTVAASSTGTGTKTGGAWRSAFNMDVTIPAQSLGLVAGDYTDKITVTLAVS